MRRFMPSVVVTLAVAATVAVPATVASAQIVNNGSFESPALPTNSYLYGPSNVFWSFLGSAGLVNGSSGFVTPSAAPNGSQVAFLQSYLNGAGSISQQISLGAAGPYQLSFYSAGRAGGGGFGTTIFNAALDGVTIGTATTTFGSPYTLNTFGFAANSGLHTLTFSSNAAQAGLNAIQNDNTAFIDAVQVTSTPEPASLILLVTGLVGVFGVTRRRKRETQLTE